MKLKHLLLFDAALIAGIGVRVGWEVAAMVAVGGCIVFALGFGLWVCADCVARVRRPRS